MSIPGGHGAGHRSTRMQGEHDLPLGFEVGSRATGIYVRRLFQASVNQWVPSLSIRLADTPKEWIEVELILITLSIGTPGH